MCLLNTGWTVVFTIYGSGGHFRHVTQIPRTNFCSLDPGRLHINYDPVDLKEGCLKMETAERLSVTLSKGSKNEL